MIARVPGANRHQIVDAATIESAWDEPLALEDETVDERIEGVRAREAIARLLLKDAQDWQRHAAHFVDAERARGAVETATLRLKEATAELAALREGAAEA